jgi:ATP-dependent DNA helicase RecQ
MLSVSGVGRVKYEKYGEAFLAVTRGGNAPAAPLTRPAAPARDSSGPGTKSTPGKLTTSLRDTLELYEDGLDIEQIAKQRGFAPSTIATHLAQLIHFGHITDTDSLITPGLIERVREVSGPGPVGPLSPLHEALGGDVPYEQLHLARAWLNRPA